MSDIFYLFLILPWIFYLNQVHNQIWEESLVAGKLYPWTIPLLRKLKNRFILVLASNTGIDGKIFLENNPLFKELFDAIFLSYELGVAKPKKRFFEIIINQLSVKGNECLIIDDTRINVQRAGQLNIDGAPDNDCVSLGHTTPPPGDIFILTDLDSGNEMPNSQDFTVFVAVTVSEHRESYDVSVSPNAIDFTYVGTGWDSTNEIFTTPSSGGNNWRYIYIIPNISNTGDDPATGAELDAVGWDE